MTGLLEDLRSRRTEIEDEIGRLEEERTRAVTGYDRDIEALRTVLAAMSDVPPSTNASRSSVPPSVRAARALTKWPAGDPITAVALFPRMGLRSRDLARKALLSLSREGILKRGADVRHGSGLTHTYEIVDRDALERIAAGS